MKIGNLMRTLVFCLVILPFSAAQAQEFRRLYPPLSDSYWGEDVILAAPVEFAARSFMSEDTKNYAELSFPLYLGYLSFYVEDDEKYLIFSPAPAYDSHILTIIFEELNKYGYLTIEGNYDVSLDSQFFCDVLVDSLLWYWDVYAIGALPIGTAKDFDFTFTNQTEFVLAEVRDTVYPRAVYTRDIYEKYESMLENLVITSKE